MYVLGISVVLVEAKLPGGGGGGEREKLYYIEGNPDIGCDIKIFLKLSHPSDLNVAKISPT